MKNSLLILLISCLCFALKSMNTTITNTHRDNIFLTLKPIESNQFVAKCLSATVTKDEIKKNSALVNLNKEIGVSIEIIHQKDEIANTVRQEEYCSLADCYVLALLSSSYQPANRNCSLLVDAQQIDIFHALNKEKGKELIATLKEYHINVNKLIKGEETIKPLEVVALTTFGEKSCLLF